MTTSSQFPSAPGNPLTGAASIKTTNYQVVATDAGAAAPDPLLDLPACSGFSWLPFDEGLGLGLSYFLGNLSPNETVKLSRCLRRALSWRVLGPGGIALPSAHGNRVHLGAVKRLDQFRLGCVGLRRKPGIMPRAEDILGRQMQPHWLKASGVGQGIEQHSVLALREAFASCERLGSVGSCVAVGAQIPGFRWGAAGAGCFHLPSFSVALAMAARAVAQCSHLRCGPL